MRLRSTVFAVSLLFATPVVFVATPSVAGNQAALPRWKPPFKKDAASLPNHSILTLGGKNHLDLLRYKDISRAAQHLMKEFPPDTHYFIGLGRDPAPIIAFLQNLGGKELAINFPASSNNQGNTNQDVLARYVERLLPPEVLTSGKTIVFVDATTSGRGLNHYVPLITPALKGAKVVQAAFGVRHDGHKNWPIYQAPGRNHVIDTTPFPEVDQFFSGIYEDHVAEYPRHVPGVDPESALDHPRQEYTQFRNALMQRMENDAELHAFLGTHGGESFRIETAPDARGGQERSARAGQLLEARRLPQKLRASLKQLVDELGPRTESHGKGPYLSENGERLDQWLKDSLAELGKDAQLVPALARKGENLVVGQFMDEVERARDGDKIRNRDYRRLMGHALSAAIMDRPMIDAMVARFSTSAHFRREIIEEASFYENGYADRGNPETVNMATNYRTLRKYLPAGDGR